MKHYIARFIGVLFIATGFIMAAIILQDAVMTEVTYRADLMALGRVSLKQDIVGWFCVMTLIAIAISSGIIMYYTLYKGTEKK